MTDELDGEVLRPESGMPRPLLDAAMLLLDSLTVPTSLHDVEGRFVYMNALAEQASGTSRGEWLGRRHSDPIPPEARANVEAMFQRAVDRSEPTDFETIFLDAEGRVRGVRAQHLPLMSSGAVVGVLILAYDVLRVPEHVGYEPELRLTSRQREILELVASGLSTAAIAKALTLAPQTVRNHVRNVLGELHVHTRLEAIATARRSGLLSPQPLKPDRENGRTL